MSDLRPLLFRGLPNFDTLRSPQRDVRPAWCITKSRRPGWWIGALSAASAFAQEHDLLTVYRAKLAAIPLSRLSVAKSAVRSGSSTFPIWEIANELLVARILEHGLGWHFESYEPGGRGDRKGDWQFRTHSGRIVFVEVKSVAERDVGASGVYSRASYAPRISRVLKSAYSQLPEDGRATLVVVVGREVTRIQNRIMHGDLFQALYGQMQISFKVLPFDPSSVRLRPSFREMFVHRTKHRRLGWVGGLVVTGADEPALQFYVVQNGFADVSVRMSASEFERVERFVVDDEVRGQTFTPVKTTTMWKRIAPQRPEPRSKTR